MNQLKSYIVIVFTVFVFFVMQCMELKAEIYTHVQQSITPTVPQNSTQKYTKNPMKYTYAPQYGDYIKDLAPPHKDKLSGNSWHLHFLTFPITYYIGPCNKNERALIIEALKQYQLYFPMQEVTSKTRAAMSIEVFDKEELLKLCSQNKPTDSLILGCGGPMYSYSQVGANQGRAYRGYLYIKKNMFYVPGAVTTVLHELGHAFGIGGHSKSPKDIMYFQLDTWALASNNSKAKDIPKHLTYRDVNTLYMIYNSWFDK